tara:strand:+ start:2762 stop:2941 length:180 start_codon:yes stop_codon:yes gene_type:complete
MKDMSKAEHDKIAKAVKDGLITQKQHDKMPAKLLLGIIKKGGNGGKKKGKKKAKKGKKK